MSAFSDALGRIAERVPEIGAVMILGTDGIPIERMLRRPPENLEAVAAEYTTLLRSGAAAASDTGLGALRELIVVSERMTAVLVAITGDYFLFATLPAGVGVGRVRFALRVAGLGLESEFA